MKNRRIGRKWLLSVLGLALLFAAGLSTFQSKAHAAATETVYGPGTYYVDFTATNLTQSIMFYGSGQVSSFVLYDGSKNTAFTNSSSLNTGTWLNVNPSPNYIRYVKFTIPSGSQVSGVYLGSQQGGMGTQSSMSFYSATLGGPLIQEAPPAEVSNLTATGTTETSTTLNFTTPTDASFYNYKIYQDGTLIYTSANGTPQNTAETYTVNGLTAGGTYSFKVTTLTSSGTESNGSVVSVTTILPDTTPPAVPAGLAATPGNGQVTLTWTANTDDTVRYQIYKDGVYYNTASGIGTTSFVVTGLTNGTSYNFQITAQDAANNESAMSAAVTATPADTVPPAVPTGLAAAPGNGQVTLTWTANTDDTVRYQIYKNGVYYNTASGIGTTSFIVTGLTDGTSYNFQITAQDAANNESAMTTAVTATPKAPPSAPTGLTTSISSGKVALSWNPVTGAAKYFVYRNDAKLSETTTASYSDSTVTNGTKYKYQVTAVDSTGTESAKSTAIYATPANVTDMSGTSLPFNVTDMIKTAINFLKLFPSWILLALGVIFAPVLIGIVAALLGFDKKKEQKEKTGRRGKRSERYAGMSKDQWEKFKAEEIKRTDDYFKKTGKTYLPPSEQKNVNDIVVAAQLEKRQRRIDAKADKIRMQKEAERKIKSMAHDGRHRKKDGSLTAREKKRIEDRMQAHITKMRKNRT